MIVVMISRCFSIMTKKMYRFSIETKKIKWQKFMLFVTIEKTFSKNFLCINSAKKKMKKNSKIKITTIKIIGKDNGMKKNSFFSIIKLDNKIPKHQTKRMIIMNTKLKILLISVVCIIKFFFLKKKLKKFIMMLIINNNDEDDMKSRKKNISLSHSLQYSMSYKVTLMII